MRTLSIVLTGLFVAVPAWGQQQPAAPAAPAAPAPAAPAPAAPAAPAAAPGPSGPSAQSPAAEPDTAQPQTEAAPSPAPDAGVQASASVTSAPPTTPVVAMDGGTKALPSGSAGVSSASSPSQRGSDAAAADQSWRFEFHGYLRAPMRVGMGKRDQPGPEQSSSTLHYPILPDDQYLSWQFTSHNKKDWAEVFFSYGNDWARGVVAMQGFNFTDAAWTDSAAQFGISQGYVELTPDLGYENVRLSLKAGSFWARYGMAGKWDSGEYDTYLFGRTHVMGEALHLEFDLDDANTLWFEHGIGTKRPDPSQFNNARFTMLNHFHAGVKLGSDIEFSAHYLHSWTQEEDRIIRGLNSPDPSIGAFDTYNPPNYPSSLMGLPDGRLWVAGLDARFELGALGYLYAGYSHIGAKNAISVGPAIEVLHAFGGGQFQLGITDNYFGPSCRAISTAARDNRTPGNFYGGPPGTECSLGNGSVDSVLAQYEFSLTNFQQISSGGQKFWGDGQDFKAVLYGMLNKVNSDVPTVSTAGDKVYDGNLKLKYGADLQFQALPWLTVATRFDRVQPNSNIPEQSFAVLSPRLVFKSKYVTREQISVQYSRYLYNQRECGEGLSPAYNVSGTQGVPPGHAWDRAQLNCVQPPAAPGSTESFGSHYENQNVGLRGAPTTRPDVNVIKVEASMWW